MLPRYRWAAMAAALIVTSIEGRPIKINGNPRHPASLGSTDVYAEAAVLSLYDPDRSKAPYSDGRIQPWSAFEAAIRPRLDRYGAAAGEGPGATNRARHIADDDCSDRAHSADRCRRWRNGIVTSRSMMMRSATALLLAFGRQATAIPRFRRRAGCADARCRSTWLRPGSRYVTRVTSPMRGDRIRLSESLRIYVGRAGLEPHRRARRSPLGFAAGIDPKCRDRDCASARRADRTGIAAGRDRAIRAGLSPPTLRPGGVRR